MKVVPQSGEVTIGERFIAWEGEFRGDILIFESLKLDQFGGNSGNPVFWKGDKKVFPLWANLRRLTLYTLVAVKGREVWYWLKPFIERFWLGII